MKYALSSEFVIRNIVDECIVVPVRSSDDGKNGFFALNMTGKIIINGIVNKKSFEEITSEICEAYETDAETACKDVREFIEEFKSMGIINEL